MREHARTLTTNIFVMLIHGHRYRNNIMLNIRMLFLTENTY